MYFCGGVSALLGCDLMVTLKKLVLGGCSSSSITELFDDLDSLPKWCSSHLDVSTFRVSSSWSKSSGFLVSASFLSSGEIPFSKPGTARLVTPLPHLLSRFLTSVSVRLSSVVGPPPRSRAQRVEIGLVFVSAPFDFHRLGAEAHFVPDFDTVG
jgi:hypothetical protein